MLDTEALSSSHSQHGEVLLSLAMTLEWAAAQLRGWQEAVLIWQPKRLILESSKRAPVHQ